jgi:DNA-binding HxlR family transcriptional regulator
VTRTVYPTIPPKVEYELTDLGRTLLEPITALAEWAQGNRTAIQAARAKYDAKQERAATDGAEEIRAKAMRKGAA